MTILYHGDHSDRDIILGQFHVTLKYFLHSIYFVDLTSILLSAENYQCPPNSVLCLISLLFA